MLADHILFCTVVLAIMQPRSKYACRRHKIIRAMDKIGYSWVLFSQNRVYRGRVFSRAGRFEGGFGHTMG